MSLLLWPVNSSASWKYRLGGGFKYLFIWTPNPGEMIQFDERAYSSSGLKPPTSRALLIPTAQSLPLRSSKKQPTQFCAHCRRGNGRIFSD